MTRCKDCKNPNKTFFGNDQGFSVALCQGLGCPSGVMVPDKDGHWTRSAFRPGKDDVPGSLYISTFAGLPEPNGPAAKSVGPEEAPARTCPKCGAVMIGEAFPKADIGPSYRYLCRACPGNNGQDYGFSTVIPNPGTPLTSQQRRLAGLDSKKLIENSEKTRTLHEKLFPLPGDPQITVGDLFPEDIKTMFKVKIVEPSPETSEVLERTRSVLGVVKKIEAARQAEQNEEFKELKERIKPILKYAKSERERQERDARVIRPDNARYGRNGRLESAGRK